MQHLFGLDIPRTLDEACDPRHLALIVYDMQVGVLRQIPNGAEITARVVEVLRVAREGACACASCAISRCRRN